MKYLILILILLLPACSTGQCEVYPHQDGPWTWESQGSAWRRTSRGCWIKSRSVDTGGNTDSREFFVPDKNAPVVLPVWEE